MRNFKVANIKCQNCVNSVKNILNDEFGDIKVDVEKSIVSLDINDDNLAKFYEDMDDIGFEVIEEIK